MCQQQFQAEVMESNGKYANALPIALMPLRLRLKSTPPLSPSVHPSSALPPSAFRSDAPSAANQSILLPIWNNRSRRAPGAP